jgi:poly(3-hydroxybutyrate) depolymerase
MSTAIRAAWRALLPALAVSGCLLIDPPGALKSHPADGNDGTAGSDGMNTGGTDAASGASGKTGATAGNGGRVNGASGNMSVGDNAGAAGESSGVSGGGPATAGAGGGSAGQNSGGMHAGGTSAGGTSAGGNAGSGGAATGGSAGSSGGSGGMGSTAAPSPGCSVTDGVATLTSGGSMVANGHPTSTKLTILSGTADREYVIDIPTNYNPTHPYRLIFSWHQAYGSDTGNASGVHPANDGPNFTAQNYAFYGLRREASAANDPAIFVAPQGIGDIPWDFARDSALFDDLLAAIRAKLCIDDKRVFSVGFSLGGMMSYALSITRQTKLRAVVAMSAVNYNLLHQPADTNEAPIAYFGTTGMSDGTCPWGTATHGGQACGVTHAQDNGCTPSQEPPTTTAGSKTFLCYDFAGCPAGYPVKVCTFDGMHTPSSVDDGTLTTDDGLKAFIPPLAWKFIAQF